MAACRARALVRPYSVNLKHEEKANGATARLG
jgi:hypothetical protein